MASHGLTRTGTLEILSVDPRWERTVFWYIVPPPPLWAVQGGWLLTLYALWRIVNA